MRAAEVEAEEKEAASVSWPKNANLGRFTNFVNLMDMAAIAVPSGVLRCAEPQAASDRTGAVQLPHCPTPFPANGGPCSACQIAHSHIHFCLFCNAAAAPAIHRRLVWHHSVLRHAAVS